MLNLISIAVFLAIAFVSTARPAAAQGVLTCGQLATGTVAAIGEQDLFTFEGQQGDIIFFVITTGGRIDPGFTAGGTLYRPDGTRFLSLLTTITTPLPQTGTYTLAIHDFVVFRSRGDYSIMATWLAPVARQCNSSGIVCGQPIVGTLDVTGEQDLFTIDAQQGDIISFVINTTGRIDPTFTAGGTLYRPDGTRLLEILITNTQPLPQSGRYTLSIHDFVLYSRRGSYSVTMTWIRGQCSGPPGPPGPPSLTPGPPTNLVANVAGSTLTLNWSPPTIGGAVTSYVLEAGTAPGASNVIVFDTGSTATSFTAVVAAPNSYFVRVKARNSTGASAPSNEVIVLIGPSVGPCVAPPVAPIGLTSAVSGQSVTLSWTAPPGPVTTYIIEAGSFPGATNIASFATGSAATSLSAVASPGTYFVRLKARNACGTSLASNEVIVTVY